MEIVNMIKRAFGQTQPDPSTKDTTNNEAIVDIAEKNELKKAIAIVDQFIANPEDVELSDNRVLVLNPWFSFSQEINCKSWGMTVERWGFSHFFMRVYWLSPEIDGTVNHSNSKSSSVIETKNELIDKLKMVCGQ